MENQESIKAKWSDDLTKDLPQNPFHLEEHQPLFSLFSSNSAVKRLRENLDAKNAGFGYYRDELKEIFDKAVQAEENLEVTKYWEKDSEDRINVLSSEFSKESDSNLKNVFDIILRDKKIQVNEAKIEVKLKASEALTTRQYFLDACKNLEVHRESYLELYEVAQDFIKWLYQEKESLERLTNDVSVAVETSSHLTEAEKHEFIPLIPNGKVIAKMSSNLKVVNPNSKIRATLPEEPQREKSLHTTTKVNSDGSITTTVNSPHENSLPNMTGEQSDAVLENVKKLLNLNMGNDTFENLINTYKNMMVSAQNSNALGNPSAKDEQKIENRKE